MKKFMIAVAALVVAASFASAGVSIDWKPGYGAYAYGTEDLTGETGNLLGTANALWQLIYAGANGAIDPPSLDTTGYVTGDDQVWAQRTVAQGGGQSEDGATWDDWMLPQGEPVSYTDAEWTTAGSVYQRVFQTASLGTVANGDYYYDSPLQALNTGWSEGSASDVFSTEVDMNVAGFAPTTMIGTGPVPEPATMSLLGLGALAMVLRRKLRK